MDLFVCGQSCVDIITSLHVSKDCALCEVSNQNHARVDLHGKLKSSESKITLKTQNFGNDERISIRGRIENSAVCSDSRNISSNDEKMITLNSVINTLCSEVSSITVKNARPRPRQRWFTEDLREIKRMKRRAEQKWLKCRRSLVRDQYKLSIEL